MRNEIDEANLEKVIGGRIDYTWDNNTNSGTITFVGRTSKTYTFTCYSLISWIKKKQDEGWSDQDIWDELHANGMI